MRRRRKGDVEAHWSCNTVAEQRAPPVQRGVRYRCRDAVARRRPRDGHGRSGACRRKRVCEPRQVRPLPGIIHVLPQHVRGDDGRRRRRDVGEKPLQRRSGIGLNRNAQRDAPDRWVEGLGTREIERVALARPLAEGEERTRQIDRRGVGERERWRDDQASTRRHELGSHRHNGRELDRGEHHQTHIVAAQPRVRHAVHQRRSRSNESRQGDRDLRPRVQVARGERQPCVRRGVVALPRQVCAAEDVRAILGQVQDHLQIDHVFSPEQRGSAEVQRVVDSHQRRYVAQRGHGRARGDALWLLRRQVHEDQLRVRVRLRDDSHDGRHLRGRCEERTARLELERRRALGLRRRDPGPRRNVPAQQRLLGRQEGDRRRRGAPRRALHADEIQEPHEVHLGHVVQPRDEQLQQAREHVAEQPPGRIVEIVHPGPARCRQIQPGEIAQLGAELLQRAAIEAWRRHSRPPGDRTDRRG